MDVRTQKLENVARFGYLTKGVVYGIVGILAIMAAVGEGGQVSGSEGAVQFLGNQPFGTFLLVVTGLGLFAYAGWRFIAAAMNPEGAGAVRRVGYAASGIAHVMLGSVAFKGVFGGGGGGDSTKKAFLADALASDGGRWAVALFGVFVIGVGLRELYKAYSVEFAKKLKTHEMSAKARRFAIVAGRTGLAARGVVFAIMGSFVIDAALANSATRAKGLGGALREIASQPFGTFLLLMIAAGLAAYGVFMAVSARYRRIDVPL